MLHAFRWLHVFLSHACNPSFCLPTLAHLDDTIVSSLHCFLRALCHSVLRWRNFTPNTCNTNLCNCHACATSEWPAGWQPTIESILAASSKIQILINFHGIHSFSALSYPIWPNKRLSIFFTRDFHFHGLRTVWIQNFLCKNVAGRSGCWQSLFHSCFHLVYWLSWGLRVTECDVHGTWQLYHKTAPVHGHKPWHKLKFYTRTRTLLGS